MRRLLVGLFALGLSTPVVADTVKYPWAKPPGPIAGRFKVSCENSQGLTIEFSLQGEKRAVGRVAALGAAGKYGYKEGEEILKLDADDYGDWVGQLKWRSVSGIERWDPIRLVASANTLNATMTTDGCYRDMPRVR
jgi:hypothetical protein